MLRIRWITWIRLAGILALCAGSQALANGGLPWRPDSTAASAPVWRADPGGWEETESVRVVDPAGRRWRLSIGGRRIGWLTSGRSEAAVDLPRLSIIEIGARDSATTGVLFPVSGRSWVLREPGSDEEDAVPDRLQEEGTGRWPNLCSIRLLDATGLLDLDADGYIEVAVRSMCACADASCNDILFVELRPGSPLMLDPAALTPDLRVGEARVRELIPSADSSRPILSLEPSLLVDCRFISRLGVRGTPDCADCCLFPVLIGPKDGIYSAYYDPQRQGEALKRAENDIGYVAAGPPGRPLRADEEALVARAASFYYLSGTGARTRQVIIEALGDRGRDLRLQTLLRHLDELFLAGGETR